MQTTITGRAWRFGSDIDTDVIIPAQHMNKNPAEYAKHTFEPIRPEFANEVDSGDIVVADLNFGIGSSREHAAVALKHAGVGAIVATSYGRIFYRNAINQGLPVLKCDTDVTDKISDGDNLKVNPFEGTIENQRTKELLEVEPVPEPQRSILKAGGATEYYTNS
jgi:3-isopropylmalate/(R)-2-methylmalate dehydratase small subunit